MISKEASKPLPTSKVSLIEVGCDENVIVTSELLAITSLGNMVPLYVASACLAEALVLIDTKWLERN